MHGRGLSALPMWIRLPLSLGMLTVLLSFQGLALMGSTMGPGHHDREMVSEAVTYPADGGAEPRAPSGEPHVLGAYYPEERVQSAGGNPDGLMIWATVSLGSVVVALLAGGLSLYLLFPGSSEEDEEFEG